MTVRYDLSHKCPQNNTRNEVWPEIIYAEGVVMGPYLTLVGSTPTGRFEHSEKIAFCPYCGADLSVGTGCGLDLSDPDMRRLYNEVLPDGRD